METFRCKLPFVLALFALACASPASPREVAAAAGEPAIIQSTLIEHVMPSRDYVGRPTPRFEWTAVAGVETYGVTIENEVEVEMFNQQNISGTSVPWPKEFRLEPGTYFWRIVGMKGGRMIADSGRAAFVLREP